MIRQIIYFILASVLLIIGAHYAAIPLGWIRSLHSELMGFLGNILSSGSTGLLLQKTLALLLLPPLLVGVPAAVYWIIQRKVLPHIQLFLWSVWLVSATLILVN